jgi:hypothetical protein
MKSIQIFTAIALITAPLVLVNADEKKPNLGRDAIYGYESVEQYGFISGNSGGLLVEAQCTEGRKVLGGGYTLLSGGAWEVVSLGPSPDGGGYYLNMTSLTEEPQEVLVTAICAFVSKKSG